MKKLSVLLIATTLFACSGQKEYTIEFELPSLGDTYIVLNKMQDRELVPVDSVLLSSEGSGEITGSTKGPQMMFLAEQGTRNRISLFIDNNNYLLSGESLQEAEINADGGPQAEFNEYQEQTNEFDNRMQNIGMQYRQAAEGGASQDSLMKIAAEYEKIQAEKTSFDSIFMAENPSSYVSLYLLRGSFYSLNDEELGNMLELVDPELHQTDFYIFLSDHLERMKNVKIGQEYVDFELPDTEGNPMKVSDVAGEGVLLIDFWASWCGPCRRANPDVVAIYDEFKDKGFDILGVSLDTDKDKWMQAIEDDQLTWNHMSDLAGWQSEGARLYAVSAIPHTVLIDQDGIIIARNLSKEELSNKLESLLN